MNNVKLKSYIFIGQTYIILRRVFYEKNRRAIENIFFKSS